MRQKRCCLGCWSLRQSKQKGRRTMELAPWNKKPRTHDEGIPQVARSRGWEWLLKYALLFSPLGTSEEIRVCFCSREYWASCAVVPYLRTAAAVLCVFCFFNQIVSCPHLSSLPLCLTSLRSCLLLETPNGCVARFFRSSFACVVGQRTSSQPNTVTAGTLLPSSQKAPSTAMLPLLAAAAAPAASSVLEASQKSKNTALDS